MIIFSKKNIITGILILYTLLNLKLLYPFLFQGLNSVALLEGMAIQSHGSNLLALFVGLFLNVALILYWLKNN